MELIPVTTKIFQPPQDDLFAAFDEALPTLHEQDVLVVSSKIVAISEGRCISATETNKEELVENEADVLIPRSYWKSPLTICHSAFIGTAGIDESNANGYFVLLPEDPFRSAEQIHAYLTTRFALREVGVVIIDSHSEPLRRGASGVSIGFWGFKPTINHVGEEDLFGRKLQIEVSNIVDGIAAGANVVMGETDECQPVVIARGVPKLTFTSGNHRDDLFVDPHEDTFRVLYEDFLT